MHVLPRPLVTGAAARLSLSGRPLRPVPVFHHACRQQLVGIASAWT